MSKYTKPKKTWQYSNKFKVKVVPLSLIEGIQLKGVAGYSRHPFVR